MCLCLILGVRGQAGRGQAMIGQAGRGQAVRGQAEKGVRQEKLSMDAVKKIDIIENTLDEIQEIIVIKEEIINGLDIEINQLKEEIININDQFTLNMEELKSCQDDNEMFLVFQNYETDNLKTEIEKRQQYIDSQASAIHKLGNRIITLEETLESVQNSNTFQNQEENYDWKECEFQRNQLLGLRHEYAQYKEEVFQNFTNVGNQNFVFERAVLSLKEVIRDNNLKIIDLKGEIDYKTKIIDEKETMIKMQNEEIKEYEENRKNLQTAVEDSKTAINEKDFMINNLSEELESPDFDFGHFMDRVKRKLRVRKLPILLLMKMISISSRSLWMIGWNSSQKLW